MIQRNDEDAFGIRRQNGTCFIQLQCSRLLRSPTADTSLQAMNMRGSSLTRQQQFTVGEQLRRLLRLIAKIPAEEMKNRVEFLGAWGYISIPAYKKPMQSKIAESMISPHLISLFARASTSGGIVRPICFAVLRLITNSNFVGCSTGRSAGLAPLRILST